MKHATSDSSSFIAALCQALRARRQFLGFTQAEVGRRAHLNRSYINDMEKGSRNLTLESLCRLADALETSVAELIGDADRATSAQTGDFSLLLVEDNPADVYLIRRALKNCETRLQLTVLEDGSQALAYMRKREPYTKAATPDLVLLDLNLPKRSGFDVLQEIKNNDGLKHIPVVVLTTSSSRQDIEKSYAMNANSLVTKPIEPDAFQAAVLQIVQYWLNLVRLQTDAKR